MKLSALNARIPVGLKKAMTKYCDEKGLKVQSFIENLIQEHLEDELDHKIIDDRHDEKTIPLEQVVANLNHKQKK